jgi:hypothetical protein
MIRYPIGQRLKRKFHDYQEVEVVGFLGNFIIILDSSGKHYINVDIVEEFFHILEPEGKDEITDKVYSHSNIDDPNRHNISGDMNKPAIHKKKQED